MKDWRGVTYDIGDTVIYPRAMYGRAVELVEGTVVAEVPNGVKIKPTRWSRHTYRYENDDKVVLIQNTMNITVPR